ncbi:hypothetical protein BH10ACT11_BH10ACT11_01110 [soil metagenome]
MKGKLVVAVLTALTLTLAVSATFALAGGWAEATMKINGTYRHGSSSEVGITGIINTSKDCTPSRKITVYKKKGHKLKRKGGGTTFSTGRWEAKTGKGKNVANGTYVAKVKSGTGRHQAKCAGDTSKPVKLP